MKKRYNITPNIGPVHIEAGYFSGFGDGDALIEASICQYINAGRDEKYFVLFSFRIWRLVLSVSVDFKKGVEK